MDTAPQIIARKFLNRTNRHLFLTGRAGTGKTTFLREVISLTHKKAVIAAPTGVAAINAGGVTLHSLFQLPFGTYIPADNIPENLLPQGEFATPKSLLSGMHMHVTKRRMIQEIELLIIDEVSMLRADILDAVDRILRSVRRAGKKPFGGVQILFIGDLLQLPPVVKDDEWRVLQSFYKSIHFFEALALKDEAPIYLELEKIYRQADPVFINILNHFRDNQVNAEDIRILNQKYKAGFRPDPGSGYIYLTTHNRIADKINREELEKLDEELHVYDAEIAKDFRDHQFPIEPALGIKKGAQVMFIKNDISGYQRYFNGKIGVVTALDADDIEVSFADGSDPVLVEKYTWYNKRYTLDKTDNAIKEEVLGTFTHYPLKLAWAVTIHKSQGLTFEKAIIDVQNAFAPGQIYVALSRMVSLEGLILSTPIPDSIFNPDKDISAFSERKYDEQTLEKILEAESFNYLRDRLAEYYDFTPLRDAFYYHLRTYTKDEKRSAKQNYQPRILALQENLKREIDIAGKFRNQVLAIIESRKMNYLDLLAERVKAAQEYFEPRLKAASGELFALLKELEDAIGVKAYIKEIQELEAVIYARIQILRKALALVEAVKQNRDLEQNDFSNASEREGREALAAKVSKAGKKSGKKSTKKAGGKSRKKGDSAKNSFEMFKGGKSVQEIAAERSLSRDTIENHLIGFVRSGDLDILELMDEEKLGLIQNAVKKHYKDSITPVKKVLGDEASFNDIRMVMAASKE